MRYEIRQRPAGPNMSVEVHAVGGTEKQAKLHVGELALAAAHPLLPRIDTITIDGAFFRVWTGEPTERADLRNRHGARVPAKGWGEETIGWVLVPPSATVILNEHCWAAEYESAFNRIEEEVKDAVDSRHSR